MGSRLNVLVVPADKTSSEVQTEIALNIRRPDGCRFVAVREGCSMRILIGDDGIIRKSISVRKGKWNLSQTNCSNKK